MPVKKKPFAIEVKNVHYSYGEHLVLDGVSFAIERGQYVGLLGPNGGGKTTLLQIILGLAKPQSGDARVLGMTPKKARSSGKIGYVPQRVAHESMDFPATVEEIVASGSKTKRFWPFVSREEKMAIQNALETADLESVKTRRLNELSGGQRQRVFIARALVGDPELLILDEPVVGVDVRSQKAFYTFVRELNKKQKLTILFVSHDIDAISREVSDVLCLNRELVCQNPVKEFFAGDDLERVFKGHAHPIHHHTHT